MQDATFFVQYLIVLLRDPFTIEQRPSIVVYASIYRMILSVPYPRKCEYLKDYSLDFEHAYMTTYLAS